MDLCSLEELVTLQYNSFSNPEWVGKATCLKNQILEVGHQLSSEMATLSRWTGQRTPWMEYSLMAGVGLFLLEWLFHTASTMWWRKLQCHMWRHPHSHSGHSSWGHSPQTSSGSSQSRGRACSCASQWACSSSQAQSPSSEASRWEGTTAPQHHGCSTVHPSQSPSTGLTQSSEHFHASPELKGKPPPTHQWDMGPLKPPVSNSHEGVHSWGALDPCIGIPTVEADNSSIRAHHKEAQHRVRHIPGLPLGVPPDMYHLCQTFMPQSETSGFISPSAAFSCSHTTKSL